jgi:acyl-CoA thioesterase-1
MLTTNMRKKSLFKHTCIPMLFSILVLASQITNAAETIRADIDDNPSLPRVWIIGDSISIGYTEPLRAELAGVANVHRVQCDPCSYPLNGGSTFRGLERIEQWLGGSNWDLIHFNWGLWDLSYMDDGELRVLLAQYEINLERLVRTLEATGAKLIWATTTPIPHGRLNPPKRLPGDEIKYNQVADEIMKRHHIAIDDLFTFASKRLPDIQAPEDVHFTDEGYKVLAHEVALHIKAGLQQ